jgi:hypothetical protein
LAMTSKYSSETSPATDEVLLVQEHEPTTAEAVADTILENRLPLSHPFVHCRLQFNPASSSLQ